MDAHRSEQDETETRKREDPLDLAEEQLKKWVAEIEEREHGEGRLTAPDLRDGSSH